MTAEAAAKTETDHHVLKEQDAAGAKSYEPVASTVKARSAKEAIRKAIGDTAKTNGVYVAIPARSFKPVKVTVHTETTVRLG